MKKLPICNLKDSVNCPRNEVSEFFQNPNYTRKAYYVDLERAVVNCKAWWERWNAHEPIFCPYWRGVRKVKKNPHPPTFFENIIKRLGL